MTEYGWKSRSSHHHQEDIFSDEDNEGAESTSKSRVRPAPLSGEEEDDKDDRRVASSRRKTSPDGSSPDKERRHKHKHNKHHHKHKKSSKKRSKSRSKSKSPRDYSRKRSRSRSRSRDRRNRYRETSRRDEETSSRHRNSRYGPSNREPEPLIRSLGSSSNNVDEDLDLANTAQPFSIGAVPLAASKLKAEIDKRKQLWSKKDKPTETATSSTAVWKQTAFSDDNDGRVSAKFKRLMGIKDGASDSTEDHAVSNMSDKQRKEYFENLEKQYEVARATTHTQRGLGLGFSSRSLFPR